MNMDIDTTALPDSGRVGSLFPDEPGTDATQPLDMDQAMGARRRAMRTLVVANQKGGVGKTTLLVHIAFFLREHGIRTAVLDIDPQGNASATLEQFGTTADAADLFATGTGTVPTGDLVLYPASAELGTIEEAGPERSVPTLERSLDALDDAGIEICLVDTPPTLGGAMISALAAADFVVSPIDVNGYAIHGIGKLLNTIGHVQQVNPALEFVGMVPSMIHTRSRRQMNRLAQLRSAHPDLMIDNIIGDRDSIAEAVEESVPVWLLGKQKRSAYDAGKEVRRVIHELCRRIGVEWNDRRPSR